MPLLAGTPKDVPVPPALTGWAVAQPANPQSLIARIDFLARREKVKAGPTSSVKKCPVDQRAYEPYVKNDYDGTHSISPELTRPIEQEPLEKGSIVSAQ